jgi:predicted translin family RNA/ssDNA-binding protein
MLDKKYFSKIREILLNYAKNRREIIKIAGDAQQLAKKSIFALQRDDAVAAKSLLAESLKSILLAKQIINSDERLADEGSFRAALEEYAEAELFRQAISNEKIGEIGGVVIDEDIYIGGLCDVPGELYRYTIKCATEKKFDRINLCYAVAEEIITELVDMDLTGYNRQKFDQAKQALQKIEQVVYEVSMKRA